MSVREAQQRIDSAEFAEWIAYHRIEPFGELRSDYRSALLCDVICKMHGTKQKTKAEDFLLNFEPTVRKVQSVEEMKNALRNTLRAQGLING
jgi:hypothetical protein